MAGNGIPEDGTEFLETWLSEAWEAFERDVDSAFFTSIDYKRGPKLTTIIRWLLDEAKKDSEIFEKFSARLGPELANALRKCWEARGGAHLLKFCAELDREDAQKVRHQLVSVLNDITSIEAKGRLGVNLESMGRSHIAGLSRESLLRTALTHKLIRLYPEFYDRASEWTRLLVTHPASKEAQAYLEEATYCYLFGLYSACAVLSRSLIERLIADRLPGEAKLDWQLQNRGATLTLRPLIDLAKNWRVLPPETWGAAEKVLKIGNKATHSGPVSHCDASDCLVAARLCVQSILSPVASARLGRLKNV